MLIDTHVHLTHPKYVRDIISVIDRAAKAGVNKLIIPGTDLDSSKLAIHIAETYSTYECQLFAAVGVHPTDAHTLTPDALQNLDTLANASRVVAIGEIGLDYYWPRKTNRDWYCATPEEQVRTLELQLELARKHQLPVILHDRDAHDDTLSIIEGWLSTHPEGSGTFHAYAGGIKHLKRTLATGMMIGMDGPVTFKNARALRAVAQAVPLDHLLLETDGPYLTPAPHRGKRNEPSFVPFIRDAIAASRECNPETVEQATTSNAERLFGLA